MEPLESKLKRALEAQDPAEDFEARVMKRIAAGPPEASGKKGPQRAGDRRPRPARRWGGPLAWLFPQAWRPAIVAGLAMVLLFAGLLAWRGGQERRRAEQERLLAERARTELLLALEITSAKLNLARDIMLDPRGKRREAAPENR